MFKQAYWLDSSRRVFEQATAEYHEASKPKIILYCCFIIKLVNVFIVVHSDRPPHGNHRDFNQRLCAYYACMCLCLITTTLRTRNNSLIYTPFGCADRYFLIPMITASIGAPNLTDDFAVFAVHIETFLMLVPC